MKKPEERVALGRPTNRRCPDDGTTLFAIVHKDVEIDVCRTCGGVWLDHGEMERLIRSRSDISVADGVLDVAVQSPELVAEALELAGDAAEVALEFIGEALSGL